MGSYNLVCSFLGHPFDLRLFCSSPPAHHTHIARLAPLSHLVEIIGYKATPGCILRGGVSVLTNQSLYLLGLL